ncbi:MAG: hypothetical protein Q9M14_03295 [Mariprofundaceae bacterium]|nr:hypothetical protein [Mariprofundaceae bacterium]
MKKVLLTLMVCISFAMTAYAGVAYINYQTGDFQCTSGYKSHFDFCSPSGLSQMGYGFCQEQVAKVCNN